MRALFEMHARSLLRIAALAAAGVAAGPSMAHHSVGVFDVATPIRVKGTVVQFTWTNPHSAIIVEQKTADGATTRWALESSAPIHVLERRGFTQDSFRVGDVIEACGFAPKRAFTSPIEDSSREATTSRPIWLDGADRVITARLLLTQRGPEVHWSHYGPLESCIGEAELEAIER